MLKPFADLNDAELTDEVVIVETEVGKELPPQPGNTAIVLSSNKNTIIPVRFFISNLRL
jgi:hypothetical protein